jgi:uncharacterized membrane protein
MIELLFENAVYEARRNNLQYQYAPIKVQNVDVRAFGRQFSFAAVMAALYAVLTVMLGPMGYSWVQMRLSEALTPLPYLFGFPAVIGLTLGCVVANIFSSAGLADMLFGPLLTLLAAVMTWKFSFGKRLLACMYPVVINAFGVSAYLAALSNVPYVWSVLGVGVGEAISAILVGYPLLRAIEKVPKMILKK